MKIIEDKRVRIAFRYNHLHAEEYLYYRKKELIEELEKCIVDIDANKYLKFSCDKTHLGEIYYDQKALNEEIEKGLNSKGWKELKISYYVTEDETVSKQIVKISDKEVQKKIIEENGFEALSSHNQVDFVKDRIAVEVQFGKYFSVAYDLHVKHTFFYLRDDIEVGIEIIPTHKMMLCMDTGVAWFENEVTNVIREGRNNPSVPVYILGIESDDHIDTDPCTYTNSELVDILKHSDKEKLKSQMKKYKCEDQRKWNVQIQKAKDKVDVFQNQMDKLNEEYIELKKTGLYDNSEELKKLVSRSERLMAKRDEAMDKYYQIMEMPPARLLRIQKIESVM